MLKILFAPFWIAFGLFAFLVALPFLLLKSLFKLAFGLLMLPFMLAAAVLGIAFGVIGGAIGLVAGVFALGALVLIPLLPLAFLALVGWGIFRLMRPVGVV